VTAAPAGQPARGRTGVLARLTAGWRDSDHPASLHEHARRYGQLPPVRDGHVAGRRVTDMVSAAGLTGRGGAGFPTGIKMRSVAAHRGPAVVVANGMESEPASEKDQALLAHAPHLVLDGIELAASAVGAAAAYLCLSRSRGWLTDIVLDAVGQRQHAGLDGVALEVHELPHNYVSSEETSLVHWLNGGDAKPTATPPRPFERGVRRRPTLVDNVETLAHIALIARYGADWFTAAGEGDMPGTMLATVTGAVADAGVYEIGGGTRIGDVLLAAQARPGIEAVLVGGYFGSWHPVSEVASLPFTKAGLDQAGGAPGAGVLFALPPAACGLAEAARILGYLAGESAQQCGPCMFGLPAIAGDLAQLAAGRPDGDPLDRLQRRFRQITGRGGCRHPDGAIGMAASALRTFAADVHAHMRRRPCIAAARGQQVTGWLPVPPGAAEGGWR
jgi:NADH:ubiquinone oxidoreductase subunit F (NADH-binding)